jgi:hypothetical protein
MVEENYNPVESMLELLDELRTKTSKAETQMLKEIDELKELVKKLEQ